MRLGAHLTTKSCELKLPWHLPVIYCFDLVVHVQVVEEWIFRAFCGCSRFDSRLGGSRIRTPMRATNGKFLSAHLKLPWSPCQRVEAVSAHPSNKGSTLDAQMHTVSRLLAYMRTKSLDLHESCAVRIVHRLVNAARAYDQTSTDRSAPLTSVWRVCVGNRTCAPTALTRCWSTSQASRSKRRASRTRCGATNPPADFLVGLCKNSTRPRHGQALLTTLGSRPRPGRHSLAGEFLNKTTTKVGLSPSQLPNHGIWLASKAVRC